jgi:ABC-type dipeptide/oligopeptide/nickel transport system permease subunit
MFVSLISVTIAAVMGSTVGLIAAYNGGKTELLVMRSIDIVLCFPPILLALFVVVFIGSELRNVILTIGVLYAPRFARLIHGMTLSAKQELYVEAAQVIGSPSWRILFRTILPNVTAPIIVQSSLDMGNAILVGHST